MANATKRRVGLNRLVHAALGLFALWCALGIALAQNENETVGFQSNHLFDSGHFGENIDILNGGLSLTTPIGQKYQVNQNLGYQLVLHYNSRIWEMHQAEGTRGVMRRGPMGLGNVLHFGRIYRDVVYANKEDPNHPGGTIPEWQCTLYYVSPDGNEHVLPGSSDPLGGATCNDAPTGGYTNDTTFYNFSYLSGTISGWTGDPTTAPKGLAVKSRAEASAGLGVSV